MRLTKKHERALTKALLGVVTLPNSDVCIECNFTNDVSNNENHVELLFQRSYMNLLKDFMKQYKELPDIDDDFKKKWQAFFKDNAIMVALCWECQYVCGDDEKN